MVSVTVGPEVVEILSRDTVLSDLWVGANLEEPSKLADLLVGVVSTSLSNIMC